MMSFDLSASPITLLLLLLNVLISGYALFMDPSLVEKLSFRPREVLRQKEYHRLITAGFVHVGLAHLAFNMWALYLFGPPLEALLGPLQFTLVYLGAELAAHGLTLVIHKENDSYAAVGASGAVSGIVFGFCLFYPTTGLGLLFVPGLYIPAYLFALLYVALSIYAMKQGRPAGMTGGIAHEAHVGGALGGLLLTILMEPRAIGIFMSQLGLG